MKFARANSPESSLGTGIGLGFFAQYAAKQGLFPVELRLALVAICGIIITAFGWRLREKKVTYALLLQGGGVGFYPSKGFIHVDSGRLRTWRS